ncbi:MAG TPA: ABC transporter permease [Vicinamibacteria bacterium]|nr:ABC transporter permease [Vicinamibacteria bacterium]
MKARVLTKVAAQSILKNKMRTLLTMLGVIIGVGAVIVMVAIGEGAKRRIAEQVASLGTNMIVITPGEMRLSGVSQGGSTSNRLRLEDALVLEREATLLSAVSPVVVTRGQVIGGQGNWRTSTQGVSTEYPIIRNWSLESGVFFGENDVRTMRKSAVIGKTVADNLFPGQDPVGERIQIRSVPFQIVGVLSRKGQTPEGIDQDDVILAPYTTVQTRLSGRSWIPQILASTYSPQDVPDAQDEIRLILREAHELPPFSEDDFAIRNQSDIASAAESTTEVMTLLLSAIASISLLVGGIGIMNIMLVSVTERTREIGLRMAIGARGSDVLKQFLVESVVVSTLGGLIGVAVGYGSALLVGRIAGWSIAISPATTLLALVFAGAVGVFFGLYPARRAAALNPIEALRYE